MSFRQPGHFERSKEYVVPCVFDVGSFGVPQDDKLTHIRDSGKVPPARPS